ncbi:MAG TPA: GNAT family N-acetyltransferase [Chloroflexia bacterium]|nr:GNAT family N-acetyltransferase [Chloroflexia bacterium]
MPHQTGIPYAAVLDGTAARLDSYTIAPAGAADRASILRLLKTVHFDTRGLRIRYFMIARGADGRVLGCAQIKPIGSERVLSSVAVDPTYRSRGVAGAIIRALLARERGPVLLMCYGALIPYYRGFGFQPTAARHAPLGLYWRWAIIAVLGRMLPGLGGAAIMARPAAVSAGDEASDIGEKESHGVRR